MRKLLFGLALGAMLGLYSSAVADSPPTPGPGITTVQDEGTALARQRIVNFKGAAVAATNDAAGLRTNVTVTASGVGACTSGQYATATNDGSPPTCAQVPFTDLSGTASTAQVPSLPASKITSGTLTEAVGGTGAGALTCSAGQHLTSNGTAYSCSADTMPGVTADSPLSGAGTSASHLAIPSASDIRNGYLTSADHITFGGKAAVGTCAAHQFISAIDSVALPTCAQPDYTDLTSTPTIPADVSAAKYILQTADGLLPNAQALGALGTGLVKNTTTTGILSIGAAGTDYAPATSGSAILLGDGAGGFSNYGGSGTCSASNWVTALSAAGAKTCTQPGFSDLSGSVAASQMPALTGDVTTSAGAVATTLASVGSAGSCGSATSSCAVTFDAKGRETARADTSIALAAAAITSGTLAQTIGGTGAGALTCTNQFVTSNGTAQSCSTDTLAGAQHANQGTTTTVLHGNGAGNPSWGAVALGTDVSGTLLAAQFPALTGDVTTSAGAVATTLATVNSNTGTFGDSTHVGQFTVNGKGLITAASSVAISAGSGTVTSVGISGPSIISWANTPVTTTGTLTGTLANQSANTVLAGPTSGSASAPTFRALAYADGNTVFAGAPETGRMIQGYGVLQGAVASWTTVATNSITVTGAGTGAAAANGNTTTHQYVKLTSGSTSSGNDEHALTGQAFSSDFAPGMVQQTRTDATISTMKHWVGMTQSNISGAANCAASASATTCGVRFFGAVYNSAADTHWLVCDADATSIQCTASTVTYSANTDYLIACDLNYTTAATTSCTFNGASLTQNTTHQPGATQALSEECSVTTLASAARIAYCGSFWVRQNQ